MRVKITYWKDDGGWLGYLQDYPGYRTQGDTLDDRREHLRDLHHELTRGEVPGIRNGEMADMDGGIRARIEGDPRLSRGMEMGYVESSSGALPARGEADGASS